MSGEPLLFEAIITPHRSLSRRGMWRLLAAIFVACTLNASVFVAVGAWPVGGFTGVELILAAVLLRLNTRAARACELLLLTPSTLRVVRTDPAGARQETRLPSGWLNVLLEERPGRVPALYLVAHGAKEEVGTVLGEAAKRDLAEALAQALHRMRNPRFDNPQLRDPDAALPP